MNLAYFVIVMLEFIPRTNSIVNPQQQSANMVIYLRRPNELGPRTWHSGVNCLERGVDVFFQRRDHLTRSYNMVLTSIINMSTPAAQIQEGFLKLMNEAIKEKDDPFDHFQLRVASDARPFVHWTLGQNELLLADFYVIVTDSVERLTNILAEYASRQRSWNPGGRFLILFNNIELRDQMKEITYEIFDHLLHTFYVHNIALFFATTATEYVIYVLDYFSNFACRSIRLHEVGRCHDGELHPDYMTVNSSMNKYIDAISLENCTFYMCASISAPFVESDCTTGLELRMVAFMKNRLKFHINQTCEFESRGVADENGEWNGLLGRLNERYCDFILGGYYPDNDVVSNFWTSDCYLYDDHTWYVKLADPRPAWTALYVIFEDETWLSIIGVLIISWFFWFVFVNLLPEPPLHTEFSLTGINAIAVSICVSVNERPLCNTSRIFFVALAVYGMNVASTYTSKLIAVFSNPGYLHQIETIEEVIELGIPFGGYEESRDWFENDDDMWIFDLYNESTLFEPHGDNLKAVMAGERVILSNRMYILQTNYSDDIFAFPSNVFSSSLQMIMKSGFPFTRELNWMIRYMRDAGIFSKINNDFIYNNTYLNRIAKMRPTFKKSVIVLTTDHLQGPFAILIVGIIGSLLLWLGELYVFWVLKPFLKNRFGWEFGVEKPKKAKERKSKDRKKKRDGKKKKRKVRNKKDKETIQSRYWNDIPTLKLHGLHNMRFYPLKRRRIYLE